MKRINPRKIAAALVPLIVLSAAALHADDWKLRKDKTGIQIFTRDVPGSKFKEFKAVTEVDASMAGVLKLMEDIDSFTQWYPNLREMRLVKVLNRREVLLYQVMKVPFPAKDRDSFFKVAFLHDTAMNASILRLSSAWDYEPERKGVVRVKIVSGSWTFIPVKNREAVTVTYQLHSEPGGSLPPWMANSAVVRRPFKVIKKMKEMLKNSRYRDAKMSELRLFR
jgi:hypothetical protein